MELAYRSYCLRAIHVRHAVINEYDCVHLCLSSYDLFMPLFDKFEALGPAYGSITGVTVRLYQHLHHLNVHLFVVDDEDRGKLRRHL